MFSANGVKIKDKEFSKRKRKNFTNSKWYDYNDFIRYWNISNIGNFMLEGWTEVDDGGSSSSIAVNIPSSCTGCPSYNLSVQSASNDISMGQSIVQFTDPVKPTNPTTTIYGISWANFQRKN